MRLRGSSASSYPPANWIWKTAQRGIASDWIEAYKKYVRTRPPAPIVHETKTAPATTANEVWVKTRSGKYWKPGSRYFGKTKEGEFMSELEALAEGLALMPSLRGSS